MELDIKSIKKALECCISGDLIEESCLTGCPIYKTEECVEDNQILLKYALHAINELTQENERLKGERDTRDIVIKELTARNSELQTANEELGEYCRAFEEELDLLMTEWAGTFTVDGMRMVKELMEKHLKKRETEGTE